MDHLVPSKIDPHRPNLLGHIFVVPSLVERWRDNQWIGHTHVITSWYPVVSQKKMSPQVGGTKFPNLFKKSEKVGPTELTDPQKNLSI